MEQIAIFGACREGIDVYRSLYAASLLTKKEVEFSFLDNDSRLSGSSYGGCKVYKPSEIDLKKFKQIIIGIISFDRAYQQLTLLGVNPKIIKRFYSDLYFNKKERNVGMAKVGKYSYFKPSTILYNVEIGNYCHIGADCRLGLIGHKTDLITTYPFEYQFGNLSENLDCSKDNTKNEKREDPLLISHDVYIGEGVTIMAGLKIGIGAVIGSKSVVTKDVPSFMVVAGTPAKNIYERVSPEIQKAIIESHWWDFEDYEAEKLITQLRERLHNPKV